MMDHIKVIRKIRDTPTVFSLYFKWDRDVKPGQFVMVWVPGHSEVPMSLSQTGKEKCLTIKMYGDTTRAMDALEPGDFIYIRGPYGKPFSSTKGKTLLIGGGSGMASLRPMINEESTGILAARGKEELLFENEFKDGKAICVTEDGSRGIKGIITAGIESVDLSEFSMIYVCGPERMLYAVYKNIQGKTENAEFSLERSMKCGIGLCDSCSVDGFEICRDGPTFNIKQVSEMEEFGITKLERSGKRIYF
jgi:dihydroorotate dehydrogenase electron transfer subunit